MTLEATLDTTIDDEVLFDFVVANTSAEEITLEFPTGKIAEVTVYKSERDNPVWRSSDGKLYTQAIQRKTLGPDACLERRWTWTDPPPGEYVATGLLAGDVQVEADTTFRI